MKMNNPESVKVIRQALSNRNCEIPTTPGVYTWWFTETGKNEMLKALPNVDQSRIRTREINGQRYWALYYGISKDLKGRIKWHVTQKHTAKNVANKFLSTLRCTISALLGLNMSTSMDAVNKFMDDHCYWEWHPMNSAEEAEEDESRTLSQEYYPLNIQKNKVVDAEIRAKIRELRELYRK